MKIFYFFFLEGNKKCRVGTNNRVGRVSGNTVFFFFFFFVCFCFFLGLTYFFLRPYVYNRFIKMTNITNVYHVVQLVQTLFKPSVYSECACAKSVTLSQVKGQSV